MGSIGALSAALSGLTAAQQEIDLIAQNISNASTPGYTRKTLPRENNVVDNRSVGVETGNIQRQVNLDLIRQYWSQTSQTAFYSQKVEYLDRIQQFHGPPDSNLSISAELSELQAEFIALADLPEDSFQLSRTVDAAGEVAERIRDFADLLQQMRNDAQTAMEASIERIESYLSTIADLNLEVQRLTANGFSTANIEDQRDEIARKLSEEMEITYYTGDENVLFVQTAQGQELVDFNARDIYFDPNNIDADNAYPAGAAAVYLGGNPATAISTIDITSSALGGKLGALIEMRDEILPQYTAQIDELAYHLAYRFNQQGVQLFQGGDGTIPTNTDPVADTTAVTYVGFANGIKVNDSFIADPTLLRESTVTGADVADGSNEVINRVLDYVFGPYDRQQATGTVDIRVAADPSTLQADFNLDPLAQIVGTIALPPSGTAINAASGNPYTSTSDQFTITVDPNGESTGPTTITFDLSTLSGSMDRAALVADIDAAAWGGLTVDASLNAYGELVLESEYDIQIGAGTMTADGLAFLGLSAGTTDSVSPYFDVQVGNGNLQRISIDPGDTEVTLVDKLNALDGVSASIDGSGFLTIRPGPDFGGDLKLLEGYGNPLLALMGSSSPVVNVAHSPLRTSSLGPGANLGSNIPSANGLIDFSQKMILRQTQDATLADQVLEEEQTFQDLVEKQFLDESGVNIDVELANLISVQNAYSASAQAINVARQLFQELLDAV